MGGIFDTLKELIRKSSKIKGRPIGCLPERERKPITFVDDVANIIPWMPVTTDQPDMCMCEGTFMLEFVDEDDITLMEWACHHGKSFDIYIDGKCVNSISLHYEGAKFLKKYLSKYDYTLL